MKYFCAFAVGILFTLFVTPLKAYCAQAHGYTITDPCGRPPFGRGDTDMHLHLTRFPGRKSGQELVINMPSMSGPAGITDWTDATAELCSTSPQRKCSQAKSARVQVLKYSSRYYPIIRGAFTTPHISGNFKVKLTDSFVVEGFFSAKERKVKYLHQPICE